MSVYVHVYVCLCVCQHVYLCVSTCVSVYVSVFMCLSVCVCPCVCLYVSVCIVNVQKESGTFPTTTELSDKDVNKEALSATHFK